MIKNLRHVAIVVTDLQKMKNFYEGVFGFVKVSEEIEEGEFIETVVGLSCVRLHWVKLRMSNGLLLELLKYESPESEIRLKPQQSNTLGYSHIAFTVEGVENFLLKLKNNGCKIINSSIENKARTVRVCYAKDPEGNIIELVEEI